MGLQNNKDKYLCSWPFGHTIPFLIRDDDCCFFTKPSMLSKLYSFAWGKGFRVSLSTIPNIRAIDNLNIPPDYRGTNKFFNILENKELCLFLEESEEKNKVEILQHGYSHEKIGGIPEFMIKDEKEIKRRALKGKKILSELFKVNGFVAPWGYYSKQAWRFLVREYPVIFIPPLRSIISTLPFTISSSKLFATFLNKNYFRLLFTSPRLLFNVNNFYCSNTYSFGHAGYLFREIKSEELNLAKKKLLNYIGLNQPFIFLNHYWHYFPNWDENIREAHLTLFNKLLTFALENDVWQTNTFELIKWLEGFDSIKMVGRRKIFFSKLLPRGLRIKNIDPNKVKINSTKDLRVISQENRLIVDTEIPPKTIITF